jgi:hypothetical protein
MRLNLTTHLLSRTGGLLCAAKLAANFKVDTPVSAGDDGDSLIHSGNLLVS